MPEVLLADNLASLSGVRHAFFTRQWGDICFSDNGMCQKALATRARMAEHLGIIPQNSLFCRQIHSPEVITVSDVWTSQNSPQADAMVTNKPGISLGILTADCVPVLLAATNAPIIGAAHAGWRGALAGILENTIEAMEKLGADRNSIHAALGPSIGQKSYEVGPEFPKPFLAENAQNERFFLPDVKNGSYHFDLKGYVAEKLRGLGLGSVEVSPADTYADPDRFLSYRYSTLRGEVRMERLVSEVVTCIETGKAIRM